MRRKSVFHYEMRKYGSRGARKAVGSVQAEKFYKEHYAQIQKGFEENIPEIAKNRRKAFFFDQVESMLDWNPEYTVKQAMNRVLRSRDWTPQQEGYTLYKQDLVDEMRKRLGITKTDMKKRMGISNKDKPVWGNWVKKYKDDEAKTITYYLTGPSGLGYYITISSDPSDYDNMRWGYGQMTKTGFQTI